MKKFFLYSVLILILVIVGVYIWKSFEISALKKKMEEQRINLTKKSQNILDSKSKELLHLTALALSWAIQKDMVAENYGSINNYLIELVKKPGMKAIFLSKQDGKIIVSTDKSLEGKEISSIIPMELTTTDSIRVDEDMEGNIRVIAPIFELNQKIGLLVLLYSKEKIVSEE